MSEGLTSHHCDAPHCPHNATSRFLGLTPLCPEHAVRANQRAAINTAIVGPVLSLCGGIVALAGAGVPLLRPIGIALAVIGGLVFLLAAWFWRASRAPQRRE